MGCQARSSNNLTSLSAGSSGPSHCEAPEYLQNNLKKKLSSFSVFGVSFDLLVATLS